MSTQDYFYNEFFKVLKEAEEHAKNSLHEGKYSNTDYHNARIEHLTSKLSSASETDPRREHLQRALDAHKKAKDAHALVDANGGSRAEATNLSRKANSAEDKSNGY